MAVLGNVWINTDQGLFLAPELITELQNTPKIVTVTSGDEKFLEFAAIAVKELDAFYIIFSKYGNYSCFSPDHLLRGEKGWKPVKELKMGERVKGIKEWWMVERVDSVDCGEKQWKGLFGKRGKVPFYYFETEDAYVADGLLSKESK